VYNKTPFQSTIYVVVFKQISFLYGFENHSYAIMEKEKAVYIANSEITQGLFHKHVYSCHMRCKANKKRLSTWVHRQTYPWKIKMVKKGTLEFPLVYGNRIYFILFLFFLFISSQATNGCPNGFWTHEQDHRLKKNKRRTPQIKKK